MNTMFRQACVFAVVSVLTLLTACVKPLAYSEAGYLIDPSPLQQTNWHALQQARVVMQQYDYSCGAAALATLIRYYFDEKVTEKSVLEVAQSLFDEAQFETIAREGLSLLEMKTIARKLGYQTASVELELSGLRKLKGPVVVYLHTPDFLHYAVFRGIEGNKVYLADPSRGNVVMSVNHFLTEWQGETFVLGHKQFGVPDEFPLKVQFSTPDRSINAQTRDIDIVSSPLVTVQ